MTLVLVLPLEKNWSDEARAAALEARAKAFAEKAHGDQKRKYTGEPYVVHTQEVARLVKEHGGSPEAVAAAHLHDTVEDTLTTHSDIEREFGPKVAGLVRELTDVYTKESYPDQNRNVRKENERFRLAQTSPEAQSVKLADLIDNSKSITANDPKFAQRYLREKKDLLKVLTRGNPSLHRKASVYVRNVKD